jgi:hypothetical protein
MKSFCSKCKTDTNQKVLFEKKDHIEEEGGWQEYNYYQIIQCDGCDTISFRKLHTDIAMNHNWDPEYGPEPFDVDLFPKRSIHDLQVNRYANTPNNIRTIYKETVEAYNNNQLILCSGGLRAILEGICIDKGIKGIEITTNKGVKKLKTDLQGKIDGLAESGYLTKVNAEILHNLRFIGNDALHELSAPPRTELRLAIDIVQHAIDTLYELEIKALGLKTGLTERKKPKPKTK